MNNAAWDERYCPWYHPNSENDSLHSDGAG